MPITMKIRITVALLGMAMSTSAGCNDRPVDQGCYPEVGYAEPDWTFPSDVQFCEWTLGTLPKPAKGYGFSHPISVSFEITAKEPCDPCDVERLDGLLRSAIAERVSQGSPSCARMSPSDPLRGCVVQPNDATNECNVAGVFFSNYKDIPVEHGCTDCRENGTCEQP